MIRQFVIAAAILFGVAACADKAAIAPPAAKPQSMPYAETEVECQAAGGKWGPVGLMGVEACTLDAPDAGKVCSDSSECVGECWSTAEIGSKATGYCQPTNMPFGCHASVKDGVVQPALCAD